MVLGRIMMLLAESQSSGIRKSLIDLEHDITSLPSRCPLSLQISNVNVSDKKTAFLWSCRATSVPHRGKLSRCMQSYVVPTNECNGTSISVIYLTRVGSPEARGMTISGCLTLECTGITSPTKALAE